MCPRPKLQHLELYLFASPDMQVSFSDRCALLIFTYPRPVSGNRLAITCPPSILLPLHSLLSPWLDGLSVAILWSILPYALLLPTGCPARLASLSIYLLLYHVPIWPGRWG